jgi:hypothetical protein
VAHVRLHRAGGEEHLGRDLGRRQVAREVAKHPDLALCQLLGQLRQLAASGGRRRPREDVQDVREKGGVRRAVPWVALEEIARRHDEEREDERVRLGEVERPFHVVLGRLRVALCVARAGVEEERVDDREVPDDRSHACEHWCEDLDRGASVPLGQVDRGQRRSRFGVLALGVGRRRQSGPSRRHIPQPDERLHLEPACLDPEWIGRHHQGL